MCIRDSGEMLNEIVLEHANSSLDNEEKITYYPYPPCADNKYIYVLTKQEDVYKRQI